MAEYAKGTSVSTERSRGEIERTLDRFGASEFAYGYNQDQAVIQFVARGLRIRFVLSLPKLEEFSRTPTGRSRTGSAAKTAHEQGIRESWRALALVIKAKLAAVDTGIVSFEEEFAANIVLPDGTSVGSWLMPQIEKAYRDFEMPSLLQIGN